MAFVEINGRRLHYLDEGQGPPVLFGHSFLWDREMWRPQIDALKPCFRCIVPDLWGHGESDNLTAAPDGITSIADDHWQLMQSLGIDEFSIVGLSIGGMWGLELALAYPAAVRRLVVMDSYLGAEPPETQRRYLGMLSSIRAGGCILDAIADAVVPLIFSPYTIAAGSPMVASFHRHLVEMPSERIPTIAAVGETIFTRPDRLDALAHLTQPVFVMVGADDASRPPPESREMANAIPRAELRIILRAGHVANLEAPDLVSRELHRFLSGIHA